jgi:hypothetical protein
MTEVPFQTVAMLLQGSLDVVWTRAGLTPVRLPPWAWAQVPDRATAETFRTAAGVRLAARTSARVLELHLGATRTALEGFDYPAYPVSTVLVVDGEERASHHVDELGTRTFDLDGALLSETEAPTVTVRFDDLPAGDKELEVWLPANAVVELRAVRADAPLQATASTRAHWVHYGSSISHCLEVSTPIGAWPAVAARTARVDLTNLGVAGSCHLDPFVARAIRTVPADCVSLKVGINIAIFDTLKARTFAPAVHGFLDTIRDGHPDVPILVVSPIVCPILEDAPGPLAFGGGALTLANPDGGTDALSLRRVRELLADVVDRRHDPHLHYLDGLRLFGEDDLDELPDGVHPSPAGYTLLGERFARMVFGPDGYFGGAGQ